jgi:hypothetical protein
VSNKKVPEMQIIREVSNEVENFYEDAIQLGDHAAYALQAAHRSQVTGLENIAESTLKTSDVFDLIKKQTARFSYWRKDFPEHTKQDFGESLLKYLEEELAKKRDDICKKLDIGNQTDADKQERRHIHLLLIRQFIRKMAAQYEFRVSPVGGKKRES